MWLLASALRSSHPPHLLPPSVVVWRNGAPVSGGLLRFGGRYFGGQWPPLSVLIWRPCFVLDPRFARVFVYLAAGRSCAFCGPCVRWAWACGWDAGGPLFTSLRGSGDAWARGILDLAPFCFPALQPVFPAAPGSSSLEWSAPPLPSSFVFLFATSPQLLHPLHLMVYAPLPSCSDHHELLLCTGYKHGQLTQF